MAYFYTVGPKSMYMRLIYLICLLALPFLASSQYLQESPSLNQETEIGFQLYPNPAYTDMVHIKSAPEGNKEITIYDVFGKVVLREKLRTNSLDISKLVAGVYLVQVVVDDKSITRKLIVK